MSTFFQPKSDFIIPFLCVTLFWSLSFFPRIFSCFVSSEMKLLYFLSIPVVLGVLATFGVISLGRFVFSRRKGHSPTRATRVGTALFFSVLLLSPLTLALHSYLPHTLPSGSELRKFDSVLWKDKYSTDWGDGISMREQMLQDVVDNILPGQPKEGIEDLLGPSLETSYFSSMDKDLIYHLGPGRDGFFNIDSEWLLIWLNKEGKFDHYLIAND